MGENVRKLLFVALSVMLGLLVISCGIADSAENEEVGHRALPELPDCIAAISVADGVSGSYVVIDAQNRKCGGVFISGEYIYSVHSRWGSTCDTELYTFSGKWRKIMNWSTEDYSYLHMVAHNAEQGEILFGFMPQEEYYYYSCQDEGNVPQHISSGNGRLMSLDKFAYYYAVMDWKWRKTGNYLMYSAPKNDISGPVLDNLYCMVRDDMAGNDGFSIVELNENMEFTEVIADVNSNVFLSQDGRKLWCISGTQLAYYDMSARKPKVQYCEEPCGMDTVDEENGITIAKSFAAASDGSRVCFIGSDGTLWMCTPDTL